MAFRPLPYSSCFFLHVTRDDARLLATALAAFPCDMKTEDGRITTAKVAKLNSYILMRLREFRVSAKTETSDGNFATVASEAEQIGLPFGEG